MSDNFKGKNHAFGECHFMNGRSRSAVALASFPGSGNTWARGLLERATGVCTGTARGGILFSGRSSTGHKGRVPPPFLKLLEPLC